MIKKYNQFVDDKINEEFVGEPTLGPSTAPARETETAPTRTTPAPTTRPSRPTRPSVIPGQRPSEEDAPLASLEEKDFYASQLNNLAIALGLDEDAVVDNTLEYEGKEIIFPSETEKFHVDGKKFNTVEDTVAYLQGNKSVPKLEDDRIDPEFEAKSYKFTRSEKRLK